MKKVGIFGLTANPVHKGHKKVVEKALLQLNEVWVTPVFHHPWNKNPVDYFHRLKMCEIMFSGMDNVKIVELDKAYYEATQKTPYSYDILSMAKEIYNVHPLLLIGEDNFVPSVWQKFYKYKEIEEEFGVVVVEEDGVHSTEIRSLVLKQQWETISKNVGESVLKYIQENHLYMELENAK